MGLSVGKLCALEETIVYGDAFNSLPRVAKLLTSGVSVNATFKHRSALYLAIWRDKTQIAELLLARGANVHLGFFTETPLHIAAAKGNLLIARKLVEKGAKVNARNHNGYTPLWLAAEKGYGDIVHLLLQQPGVDVDCPCDDAFLKSTAQSSSLCQAVQGQHAGICEQLLEHGADVNLSDINRCTPLHHACRTGNGQIASILVQLGACLNMVDRIGNTPLHTAVKHDRLDTVNVLIQAGCDVNFPCAGSLNFTPLLTAAKRNQPEIVAALCSADGVQINGRDHYSMTPLIVAGKHGNSRCLMELLHCNSGTRAHTRHWSRMQPLSPSVCLQEDPRVKSLLQQWRRNPSEGSEEATDAEAVFGFSNNCDSRSIESEEEKALDFGVGSHNNNQIKESEGENAFDFSDNHHNSNQSKESQGDTFGTVQWNSTSGCLSVEEDHHSKCPVGRWQRHGSGSEKDVSGNNNNDYSEVNTEKPCVNTGSGINGCCDHQIKEGEEESASLHFEQRDSTELPLGSRDSNPTCQPQTKSSELDELESLVACVTSMLGSEAMTSHLRVLHSLITSGADIQARDDFRKTALEYALNEHGLQSALLLICHGAEVPEETLKTVLAWSISKPPPVMHAFFFPLAAALMWSCVPYHRLFSSCLPRLSPSRCPLTLPPVMEDGLRQPLSLARYCRCVVRDALVQRTAGSIAPLVQRLPVPRAVKHFLMLSDVLHWLLLNSRIPDDGLEA